MDGAQQEEVIGVISPPQKVSYLRRRNSTGATPPLPTKLNYPSSSSSCGGSNSSSTSSSSNQSFATIDLELELVSIKPSSYTSLRDILPSSSSTATLHFGNEISIRNRLVKQAAWAYLRPMSTSTELEGRSFIHLLWTRFSVFIGWISTTFDRILREIRIIRTELQYKMN